MINLWGNGPNAAYGIGVQGWTQYYRSSGNFAWYIGGTHSDAELDPGSGGSAAMIIKRGSGNVGIGTANPPQKLSIKGLESSAHGMGAAIGISNAAPGGANWYLRAGATGTSTPESGFSIADDIGYRLVIDKSGNVGIGTNTPSDKLDVEGTVRVNDSNIWLRGGADLNHGIGWYGVGKLFATANIDGPAVFGCSGGALGTACGGQKIALYWNSAGNVGIGTTNPPQKLSISGQESSAHGVGAGIGISNTAPGGANWYLRAGATGTSTPASGFSIADDIGYRLVIDKSGNVGIGTNTPGDKLDVEGTIRVNDNNIWLRGGADINHGIGWYGGTKLFATANIDGPAVFGCSGGALGTVCGGQKIALYWNSAGNVGVGTASPTHKFHVVAADAVGLLESTGTQAYLRLSTSEGLDNRVEITNRSGGRLSLWTAGAGDIFNITRAGNVGIGTISPGSKLTVVGSIAGGETATGWVLGGGAWGPDNWLRITTTQKGSTYHDLAVNKFWAAGAQRFDLAEVTPVKDEDELEQGDVVVIDEENGLRVTRSRKPYDTSVYGIISSYETAAMIIGGAGPETVMRESGKLPIALIGRVKAKVSAEAGAIQVGDLLTTSSTPGHLMKCSNISKGTGAVVGKALEAHESGKGIITVLVTLQ
jgi:hypothetical protein